MDDTPVDYANPIWEDGGRVNNWHNHVGKEIRALWATFTDEQKRALAREADDRACQEDWD